RDRPGRRRARPARRLHVRLPARLQEGGRGDRGRPVVERAPHQADRSGRHREAVHHHRNPIDLGAAMTIVAVAVRVGTAANMYAANKSASAAKEAGRNATAESARQYNQTREDMMPWLEAGGWALDRQQQLLQGDYSRFFESPDYKAALQLGTKALDAGATAQGDLWGGGADAEDRKSVV